MSNQRIGKSAPSGTYVDTCAPRGVAIAFTVVVLVIALVPLVGMAWARTDTTTENRELVAFPAVVDEGGSFNWDILSDLGAYFEDHFAFRNQLVTANAQLLAAFGVSATDQVVVGTQGWLYYGGTLPDYLGQNVLSDRTLANIAHNLKLSQGYVESRGASFAFTIAPNKNTLDDSNMPYYYVKYQGATNAERLKPFLEEQGVNFVDLFEVLGNEREASGSFGYLHLDSHWNNRWALLAANELLRASGREALAVSPDSAEVRTDFAGDLQSMLYPTAPQLEENQYYRGYNDMEYADELLWAYEEGSDVTDSTIRTASAQGNQGAKGTLLMFRDSFGNALLPFMAAAYENASFSKMVPYNLSQAAQIEADTVLIERAERHLDYLASNPPLMASPSVAKPKGGYGLPSQVSATLDGSTWVVQGCLDQPLGNESTRLYLEITLSDGRSVVIDPFWVSYAADSPYGENDWGIMAYLPVSAFDLTDATFEIIAV